MTALSSTLEAVRARVEAQTTLDRSKSIDTLRTMSDALQDKTFAAWPGRTRNLGGSRASGSMAMVEDEITVEIVGRIRPGVEVASFDLTLDLVDDVRTALTNAAWWRASGMSCIEWVDDRRTRSGGWVIVVSTYRATRQQVLG